MIDRLKSQGESKSEILDRINGPNQGNILSRNQLEAIGFKDQFIDNYLRAKTADNTQQYAGWRMPDGSGGGGGSRPGGGGAGGGGGAPAGPTPAELARQQIEADREAERQRMSQSAFSLMRGFLKQYGLDSLTGRLQGLIQSGITDQATLTLELQESPEWKTRFSGNELLRQNGQSVLSVAEYLATERSYAQIMKNFGLPQGFYDDPADFGKFIGNNVSASELQERVQSYSDLANREDPAIKQQLASMGMGQGDLLAFMMDPDRANPLIQKKYKTALIGAAARRTGLTTSNSYAERLAGMGVTEEQAQQGYGIISENLAAVDKLGEIYGVDYSQGDFEAEVFEGDGESARKRKRLASQERASFSGSSGVTTGSLSQSTAGQF